MVKVFQSRIFSLGFLEGEELEAFKRDIISLNQIIPEKWEKIIEEIKKVIVAKTEKEEAKIYEEIIKTGLLESYQNIHSTHRIVLYFLKKLVDDKTKEDIPDAIFNDITNVISKKDLDSIKQLIEIIKRESVWYKSYKLQSSYDKGLLPFFKGIGTTVELRGIFSKEMGYEKSIDEFKKEVNIDESNPYVPTITVALSFDSGTPERLCFQISPDLTHWLIREFEAALFKVKLLEEALKK